MSRRSDEDAVRDTAERAVLGAMLMSEAAIEAAVEKVTDADFHHPQHAVIFRAIFDLWIGEQPVDLVTVSRALLTAGDLTRVGGAPYLQELMAAVPTAATAGHYADMVGDFAERRSTTTAAARLGQIAEIPDRAQRVAHVEALAAELLDLARGSGHRSASDSWRPVDLGPYLRGEVDAVEPTVGMVRSDGLRLLYPGREHSVVGEMESGKSWLALASVAAELDHGRHVVYIHFEEADPSDTLGRLKALGVPDSTVGKLLRFVGPDQPVTAARLARLLDPPPSLVVLDGVNEAMALHGWKIREEDGVAEFRRHLVKPCTAAGAATLTADHVVKDKERRGRDAIGSVHKGNGLTGALIMLENAEPFGRGQRGRSHVFVTKDRPGHLRQHGRPSKIPGKTFLGELVVDDAQLRTPDLDLRFWAPADDSPALPADTGDDARVLATVTEIIGKGHVATLTRVRGLAGLRKQTVDDALARLVVSGALLEGEGKRNARLFTIPDTTLPQDLSSGVGP